MTQEGFAENRIYVVPNGVPTGKPLTAWKYADEKPWIIGMVALFRPRKGLEVLLQAMALLLKRGKQIRLRAVGAFESHDYEIHIRALAQKLGIADLIDWVGYMSDVEKEFAHMDVMVMPSLYGEGLPMVLLEAMAAGVPVVASDIAGISQAVRHKVDGILIKHDNANALAEALITLFSDPSAVEAMRQSAYVRQANEFSDVSMAESVAEIYREVLKC